MPSPFPGMDPYLERPSLWPDLHFRLIAALADTLSPVVAPRYYVSIEERIHFWEGDRQQTIGRADVAVIGPPGPGEGSGRSGVATLSPPAIEILLPEPDEPERHVYLEIRDPEGDELITTLEVLSYSNKKPGKGRDEYEIKRDQILSTFTTLIEIDLLRAYRPMAMRPTNGFQASHYRVLVSRYEQRPRATLYPFSIRDTFPVFPVPLREGEPEPLVELKPLLDGIYDRAQYARRVNYQRPPGPASGR